MVDCAYMGSGQRVRASSPNQPRVPLSARSQVPTLGAVDQAIGMGETLRSPSSGLGAGLLWLFQKYIAAIAP